MNQTITILGATGGVGAGLVAASLAAGYRTIAVGRDMDRLEALRERVGASPALTLMPGSLETDEDAAALSQALRALRQRMAGVIASLNAPLDNGRLVDRPSGFLKSQLDANVTVHLRAAQSLVPMLAETSPGALYLLLGGAAADYPWAGHGHLSVSAAALKMLACVMRNEWSSLPVRVQQLQIDSIVSTHKNAKTACPDWLRAEDIGSHVIGLVENSKGAVPVLHLRTRPDLDRSAL